VSEPTGTDMLIFLDIPSGQKHRVGWIGDWPPPERMVVIWQGSVNKVAKVVEVENITEDWLERTRDTTLVPYYFRLRNASKIEENAPVDAHWFRGAEYVAEVPHE
jgi:hypothetical protein